MEFTKIRLVGSYTIDLPIKGAQTSDRFALFGADGLGPTNRDIFMQDLVDEGSDAQGARSQNRQIVLTIGLNRAYGTSETVSDLRNQIYGLIQPGTKKPAQILIMNGDTVVAQTEGDISSLDPAIFSKDPAVQVTFDCSDAYLKAPSLTSLVPASTIGVGFSNAGTAPTGFVMQVKITANLNTFSIAYLDGATQPAESLAIGATGVILQANDILTISTVPGDKYIRRNRGGISMSMLQYLSPNPKWLKFQGGAADVLTGKNTLYFFPTSGWTWLSMQYQAKFWGV